MLLHPKIKSGLAEIRKDLIIRNRLINTLEKTTFIIKFASQWVTSSYEMWNAHSPRLTDICHPLSSLQLQSIVFPKCKAVTEKGKTITALTWQQRKKSMFWLKKAQEASHSFLRVCLKHRKKTPPRINKLFVKLFGKWKQPSLLFTWRSLFTSMVSQNVHCNC